MPKLTVFRHNERKDLCLLRMEDDQHESKQSLQIVLDQSRRQRLIKHLQQIDNPRINQRKIR